jgi:hypothetical protein
MKLGSMNFPGVARLGAVTLLAVLAAGCNDFSNGASANNASSAALANTAPANVALANAVAPLAAATPVATTVPFVGCAQDGQGGPQPAPTGQPKTVVMDPTAATRLVYYTAGNVGVLGPKGWYCFGVYGSDGTVLYIAPGPIQSSNVLSQTWTAGAGAAIVAAFSSGDTSGRFTVAKAIARIFPARRNFAQSVISEGIEPPDHFPTGPFSTDRTVTKSDTVVEYETPAGAQGLGTTFSRLAAGASPIDGAAVLQGQTPDLVFLAVRLTPDLQGLSPAIVQQFEADAATPAPASGSN